MKLVLHLFAGHLGSPTFPLFSIMKLGHISKPKKSLERMPESIDRSLMKCEKNEMYLDAESLQWGELLRKVQISGSLFFER